MKICYTKGITYTFKFLLPTPKYLLLDMAVKIEFWTSKSVYFTSMEIFTTTLNSEHLEAHIAFLIIKRLP